MTRWPVSTRAAIFFCIPPFMMSVPIVSSKAWALEYLLFTTLDLEVEVDNVANLVFRWTKAIYRVQ